MAVEMNMSYKSTGLANLKASHAKKIVAAGLLRMGNQWHDDMFPDHFREGAKNVYHYAERTANYSKRIKRMYPNWRPWRASGQLERTAISSARIVANQKNNNMSVKIYMQRGHATTKKYGQELTKVLKREIVILMRDYKNHIISEIKSIGPEKSGGMKTMPVAR